MKQFTQALAVSCVLSVAADAAAQGVAAGRRTVAMDTVVGVQDFYDDAGAWKTQAIVDTFTTVEVAPRLQLSLRPLVWHVMTGDWQHHVVHASVRYEFQGGSKWRLEAGKFTSPIGLGMTENRANVNDSIIWWHRGYYSYLPPLGGGSAPHALISSIYPVGVQVNTSGDRWDARAAVIDRAPADFFHTEDAPRRANGVLGAGVSPRQGMRLGAATAWGRSGDATTSEPYVLVNVEGEYAFGYTKISGELTRDRFDTPAGDGTARGFTLQARQTLTPRLFLHARGTAIESSYRDPAIADTQVRRSWYVDSTVGYYVTPEVTVRLAHAAIRRWNAPPVDHQIGASLVWAKRWW